MAKAPKNQNPPGDGDEPEPKIGKTVLVRALSSFQAVEYVRPIQVNSEIRLPEDRAFNLAESGLVDILDEPTA